MIYLAIAILLAGDVANEQSARLTLLDGTTVVGPVTRWDQSVVGVEGPEGSRDVSPAELLDVEFGSDDANPDATAAMSVELVDGTRLAITEFSTNGGVAAIATPHSERPLRIDTAKIARVQLQPPTEESTSLW